MPPTAPQAPSEPLYPTLEAFIETASRDQLTSLFQDLKASLAQLKGARAEQGKKALKSIEKTEELLSYLMQVREKLETNKKPTEGVRK